MSLSANVVRTFSRQSLLRLNSQESSSLVRVEGLIFKGAVLMSLMGLGFSMFGMTQLQDTRQTPRLFTRKS